MRRGLVLLVLLVIPLAFAADSTNATGGYITPVNLTISQQLSYWYFFYGTSTGGTSTLVFNNTNSTYLSNSTPVYFSATHNLYFISDSPLPFSGPFVVPTLSEIDAHFNLPEVESVSKVFNDTSSFALENTTGDSAGTLALPTLYIPGANSAQAFREGIVKAGTSFLFVIPASSAVGLDGLSYDYQFFLPYSYNGSQTFYAFSVVPPANNTTTPAVTPAEPAGGAQLQPLNYNWNYNDGQLSFSTEPAATIVLISELGQTYTFRADQAGQVLALLAPGRYTMQISKLGYISMTDNLYIPSTVTPLPPQVPPVQPPSTLVSITPTPDGNLICFGNDCYLQAGDEELQALTELSCTGSICRLVGINQTIFVQKHGLKPYFSGSRTGNGGGPLNFSRMMEVLGQGLSQQFGPSGQGGSSVLLLFAFAALIGAAALLYFRAGPKPRRGGYD